MSEYIFDQVGTFNTTGERYRGHYSIWITNEIEDLKLYLKDTLIGGYTGPQTKGWINGNWYKKSREVPIGVLPIPKDMRDGYHLDPYTDSSDTSTPTRRTKLSQNQLLAKLLGTRIPILPVSSPREESLFREFMERYDGGGTKLPNWNGMAKEWNQLVNRESESGKNLFYKVSATQQNQAAQSLTVAGLMNPLAP